MMFLGRFGCSNLLLNFFAACFEQVSILKIGLTSPGPRVGLQPESTGSAGLRGNVRQTQLILQNGLGF